MRVTLTEIEKIKPYDRNPRKNAAAVAKVAGSIENFGFRQPIVVDSEMVVIAGHTRLEAAKSLGLKKVPITIAKDLSAEQVRAYRIADNQVADQSEWDEELLAIELGELQESFDINLLGFEPEELERALAGLSLEDDPSVDAAGYEPNLTPATDGGQVSPEDISRTAQHMRDQFASAQTDKLVTVMCPHCAGEFSLDKGSL